MPQDNNSNASKETVIVSLTSFPAAIPYAIRSIRSVLEGSVIPDKVVLYLDTQKFPGEVLPEELEAFKRRYPSFEVRFDPAEIRSYKKLVPALKDFPDAVIVTVDDDIVYHRDMLRDLLNLHKDYPDAILAHRAKRIRPGKPYRTWKKYRWYDFVFRKIHSGFLNLQTGVGGVLYPPHSLKTEMLDERIFTRLAPTTDDIWFWAAAVAKGTPVIPVPFGHNKPKGLGKPRELSLKTYNFKSGEDRNAAALQAVIENYPEIGKATSYHIQSK